MATGQRGGDHADARHALLDERDRDPHLGEAAEEVGGAVERVDHPHAVGHLSASLLGEHIDRGLGIVEHGHRGGLGGAVDHRDVVAGSLQLRLQWSRVTPRGADDVARRLGGGKRQRPQFPLRSHQFSLSTPGRTRTGMSEAS